MEFTGERFVPDLDGEIRLEHYHRYAIALELVKGKVVLDLACGEGYGTFMLSKYAHRILGMDISDDAILDAQKKYATKAENLRFQQGSASNLTLENSTFDVVVSYETIEHLFEQSEMLSEIRRVLKPDGILIISSPNKPVYSRGGEYQNNFHVKELDFFEFDELLKKQFKAVDYFGQCLQIGSVIKSINQKRDCFRAWSDDGEFIKPETANFPDPVYFIAVCASSSQYLPEVLPSVFYPNTFDLLAQYQGYAVWANATNNDINEARRVIQAQEEELQKIGTWAKGLDSLLSSSRQREQSLVDSRNEAVAWAESLEIQLKNIQNRYLELIFHNDKIAYLGQYSNYYADKANSVIQASNSWVITKPLREVRRWISSPIKLAKRYAKLFFILIKRIYQKLPFSYATKNKHKILIRNFCPWLLRLSNRVNNFSYSGEATTALTLSSRSLEIDFELPASSKPIVSVIIPIYGKIEFTLACLRSIAKHPSKTPFEVIVINDCSTDNSAEILAEIKGLKVYSNSKNQGFIRSCNFAARISAGQYIYFLNNDTEVTKGWLDNLYQTFSDLPGTGIVGSKLIYPDGTLQEAGGIIWSDGSAWNFGKNQDANLPVFNYAREVDYCSGASIMISRDIFEDMGGFDEIYAPAYCEDSDLALKVRKAGYRVIYQPSSVVIHFEGVTSGADITQGVKAYQVENSKKLFSRWQGHLVEHQIPGGDVDRAKDRRAKRRVLVLDHCTPTPNQDAGSVTVFNLLLLLREMDFQVTFIPEDNFLYMSEYTTALQRVGIEVLYAPYVVSIEAHLKEYGSRYDLIFLFRPTVVERNIEALRQYCPKAKVLFHTVDLHFLRMQREAELLNDKAKMKQAAVMRQREFAAIRVVDATIVHSSAELELLRPECPVEKISVFPLIMDVPGTNKSFSDRRDIVFVGGYQHTPNIDAVQFFVSEIMPLLRKQLPGVRFYVVGSKPPDEITTLACEDVIITGFIEDLTSMLDKMRVSVVPLRYGAGIKGKVGSAMAVGLPVVATSIAAEGMSLTDGENILVADGVEAFASTVVSLYESEVLWNKLSEEGLKYADQAWGAEAAWDILANILSEIDIHTERGPNKLSLYMGRTIAPEANNKPPVKNSRGTETEARQEYLQKIQQELSIYEKQVKVHDLPEIYHYWSNKFLAQIFQEAGVKSIEGFFVDNLLEAKKRTRSSPAHFVSIGSGNCDLEINIAKLLVSVGCQDFIFECVEINPVMLERGKVLARENGLSANMKFIEADFNSWRASKQYDAVMANQSLHHVTDLEYLYDQIKIGLQDKGSFVISDMVGRNGHQRWPESLEIVNRFWKEMPASYKFNALLKRHEEQYENWDCSKEGFEGIRAQDVLPLLVQRFECEKFIGFGSAIDIFVDRCFGHNFNPNSEWDRDFIERVHAEDEALLKNRKLTPTHMLAVFVKNLYVPPFFSRGLDPISSIRNQ